MCIYECSLIGFKGHIYELNVIKVVTGKRCDLWSIVDSNPH